ncbi:MAG: hypothetical protein HY075_07625 [Deltaproteobacteria bacterium]|nr:hypothetical protein [Deltaproteobacteria bacterium]
MLAVFASAFWLVLAVATGPVFAGFELGKDASGPSGSSSAPAEEPLEFPYVMFESKVYAPNPKTGCPTPPGPTEMKWLPCEADSYEDMCRHQDKHNKEVAAAKAARVRPYMDAANELLQKARAEAAKRLGPAPDKIKEPAKYARYAKERESLADLLSLNDRLALSKKVIGDLVPTRDKVLATVARVRQTLRRALADAPKIKPYDYMLTKILDCKLSLKVDPTVLWDNATMNANVSDTSFPKISELTSDGENIILVGQRSASRRTEKDGFEVLVNPLEEAEYKCNLTLTPTVWLDCVDATPQCIRTIFHELGHTLNSCQFYWMNSAANTMHDELKDASVDSLKHAGTYMKFLADESLGFARTLVRATGCLSALSAPKDAVESACPRDPAVSDEYFKHCGSVTGDHGNALEAAAGFPAQWDEAEADFWAATGMAQWLTENYPSQQERMSAFYGVWAEHCASIDKLGEESAESELFSKVKFAGKAEAGKSEGGNGCLAKTKAPTKALAWNDTHQSRALRANRNYMRNSDLRRALGCTANPEIPLTCSPIH